MALARFEWCGRRLCTAPQRKRLWTSNCERGDINSQRPFTAQGDVCADNVAVKNRPKIHNVGCDGQSRSDLREIGAAKHWPDEVIEMAKGLLVYGDPDTVGERLQAAMDTGIDGLTVNLPGNGHKTDRIGLLAEIGLQVTA